jgi:hypothetical protein
VLGYLNTAAPTYLARVRNPNPAMPDYRRFPLSRSAGIQEQEGYPETTASGNRHRKNHGRSATLMATLPRRTSGGQPVIRGCNRRAVPRAPLVENNRSFSLDHREGLRHRRGEDAALVVDLLLHRAGFVATFTVVRLDLPGRPAPASGA